MAGGSPDRATEHPTWGTSRADWRAILEKAAGQKASGYDFPSATYRVSINGHEVTLGHGSVIGQGSFGCVFKSTHPDAVIKRLKLGGNIDDARREVYVLKQRGELVGWAMPPGKPPVFIMKKAGDVTLWDELRFHRSTISTDDWLAIVDGVLRDLVDLQNETVYGRPVLHTDIKGDNVMLELKDGWPLHLIDYGLVCLPSDFKDVRYDAYYFEACPANAKVVNLPNTALLVPHKGGAAGKFCRRCNHILADEGGIECFYTPKGTIRISAATDLYAVGVMMEDALQNVPKADKSVTGMVQDLLARAASQRHPIPTRWVAELVSCIRRDYRASESGEVSVETLAAIERAKAASVVLAELAEQRTNRGLTDTQRADLEARIADCYASFSVATPDAAVAEGAAPRDGAAGGGGAAPGRPEAGEADDDRAPDPAHASRGSTPFSDFASDDDDEDIRMAPLPPNVRAAVVSLVSDAYPWAADKDSSAAP